MGSLPYIENLCLYAPLPPPPRIHISRPTPSIPHVLLTRFFRDRSGLRRVIVGVYACVESHAYGYGGRGGRCLERVSDDEGLDGWKEDGVEELFEVGGDDILGM